MAPARTDRLLVAAAIALAAPAVHAQASLAAASAGTWAGTWFGQTRDGTMEMVIQAEGDTVSGRARSGNSPDGACSSDWAPLKGTAANGRISAEYVVPGRCGRTEVTFTLEPGGDAITGEWRSAWPSFGTFKLVKQAARVPSFAGTWKGIWQAPTVDGRSELVLEAKGHGVTGRVRSWPQPPGCTEDWAQVSGTVVDGKLVARVAARGICGTTDVVYTINAAGTELASTWKNELGISGTSRFTREP